MPRFFTGENLNDAVFKSKSLESQWGPGSLPGKVGNNSRATFGGRESQWGPGSLPGKIPRVVQLVKGKPKSQWGPGSLPGKTYTKKHFKNQALTKRFSNAQA